MPAPPEPAHKIPDKVTALAAALASEKVDVFLEPIKRLDSAATQHFELKLRLQLGDGSQMDRVAYSSAASGSAILPLIDTVAIVQARKLVWQNITADSDGCIFTQIAGESVVAEQFKDDVERMAQKDQAFPRHIVLALDLSDARHFTGAHLRALKHMSGSGLTFALDGVTHLDIDFEVLARAGFRFVRLEAGTFLDGLAVGTARVPAADICRHLESLGLRVIVGQIHDAEQLGRLRSCGVLFGQGPLFGTSHVIRADVPRTN